MDATWMFIDRGIDKEHEVHIYNGILHSHKKEWNNAICSNMDGPRDYHTEWSQTKTNTTYMWNIIKNDTKQLFYKAETNSKISKPIL